LSDGAQVLVETYWERSGAAAYYCSAHTFAPHDDAYRTGLKLNSAGILRTYSPPVALIPHRCRSVRYVGGAADTHYPEIRCVGCLREVPGQAGSYSADRQSSKPLKLSA